VTTDVALLLPTIDTIHVKVGAVWGAAALGHLTSLDLINEVVKVGFLNTYSHDTPREVGVGGVVLAMVQEAKGTGTKL
jgi:hypothetical protein